MEMYLQGVSTRKVTEITEALCGSSFSRPTVSRVAAELDAKVSPFTHRRLKGSSPYLILASQESDLRMGNEADPASRQNAS